MSAVIGFLILIASLVVGNVVLDSKVNQTLPIPTPSAISIPTNIPAPTVTDKQVKGISTAINGLVVCIGPDGIHFKTTEIECKKFNDAWGKQPTNPTSLPINPQNNNQNSNYQYGDDKFHCYYNEGGYNFDFGMTTLNECLSKSDAYWASIRVAIPTYSYQSNPSPTQPPQKSAEDIQKCKDAVREKYDNLIRGCYVRYQGSAANMCAAGYQSQSGPEWAACEE